jgi:16S rRNA (guanine(527)-N(7))-methyltransferase RsmG
MTFDKKLVQDAFSKLETTYNLSSLQIGQFKKYLELLQEWNDKFNITAHNDPLDIITFHFFDSLALSRHYDLSKIESCADVGTGGGFPGLPLKIMYPHLQMVLIEVNGKKREFLAEVVKQLGLEHVEISGLDWRTFLRHAEFTIDLFIARASLQPDELLRIFKPSSPYQSSQLIYWASENWEPTDEQCTLIVNDVSYDVGSRQRRLICFKNARHAVASL